ncbi:MAG: hypothetical protein CMF63_00435, partial [Magnetovibrio sp.]|nr:hypothetical protein [Magnetovibrio sp.]
FRASTFHAGAFRASTFYAGAFRAGAFLRSHLTSRLAAALPDCLAAALHFGFRQFAGGFGGTAFGGGGLGLCR